MNSPHKWPVTRKIFPFDDVIMNQFCSYGMAWPPGVTEINVNFGVLFLQKNGCHDLPLVSQLSLLKPFVVGIARRN